MTEFCPYQLLSMEQVHCLLGGALFSYMDSTKSWACAGCTIPRIMANRPCIYLDAVKQFTLRGHSLTYFKCALLGIVMEEPEILCPLCADRISPW